MNDMREILLFRQNRGNRVGKWSLPGDRTKRGESRGDAAKRATYKAADVEVAIDRLYYENRHSARIYRGKPTGNHPVKPDAKWFSLHDLPGDRDLAFAVDVRTIERWARDNGIVRH